MGVANEQPARLLLVDDDPAWLRAMEVALASAEVEVATASSGDEALIALSERAADLALVDLRMPGTDGLTLLGTIRRRYPDVQVIVISGHGTIATAVQAVRAGAVDFLTKPVPLARLRGAVQRLTRSARRSRKTGDEAFHAPSLIGESPSMRNIYAIAARAAENDSTVLITGESGTGKELLARSIHTGGKRSGQPFVPIDCSAINPNLIESELFGHVRGAFTGAYRDKEGMLLAAGDGTVFLDEIGEIPPEMQSKLLRAIQERRVRPVGGTEEVAFDARIIAATNRNLRDEVQAGKFREDLYYRLNVISVQVPSLRQRRADIPTLAEHFLASFNAQGRRLEGISPEAMQAMLDYGWPGNVRELENAIERAFALSRGPLIELTDLPPRLLEALGEGEPTRDAGREGHTPAGSGSAAAAPSAARNGRHAEAPAAETGRSDARDTIRPLHEVERDTILHALDATGGNRREAARLLQIGKSTLYRKLKSYGIDDDDDGDDA